MDRPNDQERRQPDEPIGAIVRREQTLPYDQAIAPVGLLAPHSGGNDKQALAWQLMRILRFKWTMIITFVLVAAPAIAAVWLFTVPQYTAKAEVRVRPIIPHLVFKTEDNGMIPLYQSYVNTQISIIRNPGVLQRVLDQKDVQATSWYRNLESSILKEPLAPLERLRKDLLASPRGTTELIDVSLTTLNANDAAVITNAVLDQYISYTREQSDATSDLLYKKLTEEFDSLRSEIESRGKIIASLRKELGTGEPDLLVSQIRVRLDEIAAKFAAFQQEAALAQWQENELATMLKNLEPKAPEPPKEQPDGTPPATTPATAAQAVNPQARAEQQPRYEVDEMWRRFYFDVKAVQSQIDIERQRIKDSHPKMVEFKKRLEIATATLRERKTELDEQWRNRPETQPVPYAVATNSPNGMQTTYVTANVVRPEVEIARELETTQRKVRMMKYQEPLLANDIKKQQDEFGAIFEKAQMLAKENETVKHKRELYGAVRTRLDQKEMERNVPGSIEVLTRASPPSEASSDRRLLLAAMALAGAAAAAIAMAYLRTSMSQDIHEADDIAHAAHAARAPFLGQLPMVPAKEYALPEESPLLVECMRMVRTALLQRMNSHHGNIIQVTSAEPGAGKSTVAALLGKSLAQCGKKVLLVDADLRNPSLSGRFAVALGPGFIGTLTGAANDSQAIVATDTPFLSILPAGKPQSGVESELTANGAFAACLERWRRDYDIVLLDSSPLLPVADARILAQKADGSILVVREKNSRRTEVFEALSYLQVSGGTLLGMVFIGSGRSHGYGYGYHNNYSYTGQATGRQDQDDSTGQS